MDEQPETTEAPSTSPWEIPLEESHDLQIDEPSTLAGGIPAILSSLTHTTHEMGLTRGGRALLQVNQKQGFDCPGCGWPDPDGNRAITEFCENGVKAVAHEATTRGITHEFFQRYSIEALGKQSDYWL
ncbi:MAG: hypothetical protein P8X46_10360 [Nitrospirales bacterium]